MPLDINMFRREPDLIRESQRRRFQPVEIVDEVSLSAVCRQQELGGPAGSVRLAVVERRSLCGLCCWFSCLTMCILQQHACCLYVWAFKTSAEIHSVPFSSLRPVVRMPYAQSSAAYCTYTHPLNPLREKLLVDIYRMFEIELANMAVEC